MTGRGTNRLPNPPDSRPVIHCLIALAMFSLFTACGAHQVKNQPPLVQVSSWHLQGSALHAMLRLRNINDEPLEVARLQFTAAVRDVELARYQAAHSMEVSAHGFESLTLTMNATPDGTALLADLQEGRVASLPYHLEGHVETAGGRQLGFEREGHIYTVPGRPGHFR